MNSSTAGRSRPSVSDDSGLTSASKRMKCSDDKNIGYPIDDDTTAKRKLREAGFNPESVSEPAQHLRTFLSYTDILFTPMIYFSYVGDLPMCRYLYLNGDKGDVTKSCSEGLWFPMKAAAYGGKISVCKWLYEHGAAEDVCGRPNTLSHGISTGSPLNRAYKSCSVEVCKWLILKGALHGKPGGEFDERAALTDIFASDGQVVVVGGRVALRSWAQNAVSCYETFRVFLLGALPLPADCSATLKLFFSSRLESERSARIIVDKIPPKEHVTLLKELSPLHVLSGFPGILEAVADFVGVVKSCRHRQILNDVATFYKKNPQSDPPSTDESSSDDEDERCADDEESYSDYYLNVLV